MFKTIQTIKLMKAPRLLSIVIVLLSIVFSLNIIICCSKPKNQKPQNNLPQIKDTVLENLFLSIPIDLTRIEASQLLEGYVRDSIIWKVSDYSYRANNFEQILAEVNFGDVNYEFKTNFIVKMNKTTYNDTDPTVYLIFYNQKLLALELEIRDLVISKESTIKELSDSISSMYTRKYGEPTLKNKRLETYLLENIEHEIDIDETPMSDGIMRRWKENVKSELTEWTFINAKIKIITSQYKEYFSLNYKKEEPTEYIWETVHIFYINTSTVAQHDQDIKDYRDSIELQNMEKEKENRIKDSLKNIQRSNIYIDQHI